MPQLVAVSSQPNQTLTVALAINGSSLTLQLSVSFNEMAQFWVMDIADQNGNPILNSVPLLTGLYPAANILAPYQYFNIGSAYVINASGVTSPDFPNSTDLGSDFVLLWTDNTAYVPGQPFGVGVSGPVGPPGPPGPPGPGFGGFYFMGASGALTPVPLVEQATQVCGASSSSLALSGNATVAAPAAPVPGLIFFVLMIQPSGGGCNVTFNGFYKGLSTWSLDTTGNTYGILTFQVNPLGTSAQSIGSLQSGIPLS